MLSGIATRARWRERSANSDVIISGVSGPAGSDRLAKSGTETVSDLACRVCSTCADCCVQVLMRLRPVVEALASGAIVHVVTDDPAAPIDLPAWCHLTGHRYRDAFDGDLGPTYRIEVAASAMPVGHTRPWAPAPDPLA